MKVLQIYSVVTAVLAIGGRVPMYADEPVAEGYPSKGFFQKSGRAQDARFVLHEERDLRLLFCDRGTLKDRMNRSVCVVDDVRATLAKDERNAAREIHIDRALSVRELLEKIGFAKWSGGQPQLRVVKRDAIIQSPLESDTSTSKPDIGAFLNQELEPGDFLVVAPKS